MSKSRDAADQINRVNSSAANATAITIDANENVGIGTTAPNRALTLENGDIQIHDSGTSGDPLLNFSVGNTQASPTQSWSMRIDNSDGDKFQLMDVTDARIVLTADGSGNVGIGTSSPSTSYKNALQVHGADGGGNIRITNDTTGSGTGNGFEAVVVGIDSYLIQREAAPLIFYTNNSEAMRIDSSGAVTMPAQPAFSAINNTASQTNLAINAYHTVVFGGEIFDQGSDFASNTFTAPVTGRYQFNVQIRLYQIDTAAEYYQAYITTSNRGYEVGLVSPLFTSDPTYMTLSSSFLVDMDAADTAYVRFYQAGGSAQTDLQQACSIFSGYLVA